MAFRVRVLEIELTGRLSKENRHRLERVMRLRPGDAFVITDGMGHEAEAVLEQSGDYLAQQWHKPEREAGIEVTLFAALTKGEKFDWLVEKAVELGVRKIVPVISQHCVVKKFAAAKCERWQKIALSAMLQCGGCILPEVAQPQLLNNLKMPDSELALVLHESAEAKPDDFSDCRNLSSCLILTGPEGGFAADEIEFLVGHGWQKIWLGPRIFRAETAPILALSAILAGSWGR